MKAVALITGITGMVGSHLADYLLEHTDWDVVGMCRWRSPQDNTNHLLNRANAKDRLDTVDNHSTHFYLFSLILLLYYY